MIELIHRIRAALVVGASPEDIRLEIFSNSDISEEDYFLAFKAAETDLRMTAKGE